MQQLKLKLLELDKTRTKNASPHMFNFYVVLPGCDTAGLPRAGENSKPHLYDKKYKNRTTFRKHVLTGKQFEDFRRKKEQKHYFRTFKKPSGIQGLWARQLKKALVKSKKDPKKSIEHGPPKQQELN